MAVASEGLEIVRQNADGSLQWQEELVAPGAPGSQCAVLANLDMATEVLGATAFAMTDSGDWIARVQGIEYNVLPAIIPKTGRFAFIGLPLRPGGSGLGDPSNVRPTFAGAGDLTADVRASQVAITADFSGTGRLWSRRLTRPTATPRRVWFTGEGSLTAERKKVRQRTRHPHFFSAGRLTATVVELLGEQVAADLTGEGSLTASVKPPIGPIKPPTNDIVSDFNFWETSGPTASSSMGGYKLTAQDPSTAWNPNGGVDGHFIGKVATGLRDEWTVRITFTIGELDPPTPGSIGRLEGGCDAYGQPWGTVLGVRATDVPGEVNVGLWDQETSQWVWSTSTVGGGSNFDVTSNPAANTTTTLGVTLPHKTLRNFDYDAQILDAAMPCPRGTTVTNLEYYADVRRSVKT